MNQDIELMIKIYNTNKVDWLGYEINSPSDLTRHHIIKKEKGGIDDINNYALLTTNSHRLLHLLEDNYNNSYIRLNELFKELNNSKKPPNSDYYKNVNIILKRVKKDIKNRRRNRENKRR